MEDVILGIDFGTTNSCVSYYKNNDIVIIPNPNGNFTTPTCVYFDKYSDNILVGETAFELLSFNKNDYLGNILVNFKRILGLTYDEFKNNIYLTEFFKSKCMNVVKECDSDFCGISLVYNKEDRIYSIESIVKIYLKYIVDFASQYCNQKIVNVVITIPAYFTDLQRQMIKSICDSLSLNVLRIINEPTAAALAYVFNNKVQTNECILVLDCGGGTTDISLLDMDYNEMFFEVISVYGDNFLGGEDFTNCLLNWVIKEINSSKEILNKRQINKIKEQCENAKCQLSFKESDVMYFENLIDNKDFTIKLSKSQFYEIVKKLLDELKLRIQKMINENSDYCINKIVFVGGTTRMPCFIELINKYDIEICNSMNPDTLVSIGAAYQGALLNKGMVKNEQKDIVLMDIVPLSLGIKTNGGIMTNIIQRNTPIPVSKYKIFTNSDDYTSEIIIDIYQGERRFVIDNQFLSSFTLNNLDNTLERESMKIKVTFDVNSNGMIFVMAEEMGGDNKREILVTKSYKEVEKIIEEAEKMKYNDAERENKINIILKLRKLLQSIKKTENGCDEVIKELFNELQQIEKDYDKYELEDIEYFQDKFIERLK